MPTHVSGSLDQSSAKGHDYGDLAASIAQKCPDDSLEAIFSCAAAGCRREFIQGNDYTAGPWGGSRVKPVVMTWVGHDCVIADQSSARANWGTAEAVSLPPARRSLARRARRALQSATEDSSNAAKCPHIINLWETTQRANMSAAHGGCTAGMMSASP